MRLAAFAKHVGQDRLPVDRCVVAAGRGAAEAKAFSRIFGISHVAALPAGETIAQSLSTIMDSLLANAQGPMDLPDTLIYVHANPIHSDEGLPKGELAETHALLARLEHVYEMDQHCCSTLFWALAAARNLLEKGEAHSVVILAGDSFARLPLSERYVPACTALGDAFAGLVLDRRVSGAQIVDITVRSHPEFYYGHFGTDHETRLFNMQHTRLVKELLDRLEYSSGGEEPIIAHNVNRFSWDKFCAEVSVSREHIWTDLLPHVGHCCSTDAFLMLDRFMTAEDAGSAVLISVGQGGFVGGCRVRKSGSPT